MISLISKCNHKKNIKGRKIIKDKITLEKNNSHKISKESQDIINSVNPISNKKNTIDHLDKIMAIEILEISLEIIIRIVQGKEDTRDRIGKIHMRSL